MREGHYDGGVVNCSVNSSSRPPSLGKLSEMVFGLVMPAF